METIEGLIRICWDHYDFDNAIILAELNFAETQSDYSAYLLATSYFRNSQYSATYYFLKNFGIRTVETKFLFAKCCEQLDRYTEAEEALTFNVSENSNAFDSFYGRTAPFAHAVLARIYSKTNRPEQAIKGHRSALNKCSNLYESFKAIRNLGGNDSVSSYFSSSSVPTKSSLSHLALDLSAESAVPLIMVTPEVETACSNVGNFDFATPNCSTVANNPQNYKHVPKAPMKNLQRRVPTESGQSSQIVTRQRSSQQTVLTQTQSKIVTRSKSSRLFQSSVNENENDSTQSRKDKCELVKVQQRKNNRFRKIENDKLKIKNETTKFKRHDIAESPTPMDAQSHCKIMVRTSFTDTVIFEILRKFAEIEVLLSRYDCQRAIELTQSLPEHHRWSPLGLSALARAYFEQANYTKAVEYYNHIRRKYNYFVKGMEFYSTALWHLQKDMDLSALAQELTEQHRFSAETWCGAGNCFSLQKDNDTAIRFFQRAIQLNPDFAYAYTLLGHEYVTVDAYEQALQCFRAALRLQPRHYNAWFGIGLIYYKQEKLGLAQLHLRRALEINPRNSVLMCHVSLVQQGLDDKQGALKLLDEALALSPRNLLCRYRRAHLLFVQDRFEEALLELNDLKQSAPKEPMVYFLAGKVHKKMGHPHLALLNFSWATELDPKGEQHNPVLGDRRYDEEPVTALTAMDSDECSQMQMMDSEDST